MQVIKTANDGVVIIEPRVFTDSLGIDWYITAKTFLSEKDTNHSLLKDFDSPFGVKFEQV